MLTFATTVVIMCALIMLVALCALALKHMPANRSKPVLDAMEAAYLWCRKNAQELIGLPAALVLYWVSGLLIRWFEPSSALYDSGVLQGGVVAILHLLVGNSIARFGVRMNIDWFSRSNDFNHAAHEQHKRWLFTAYLAAYCLLAALI